MRPLGVQVYSLAYKSGVRLERDRFLDRRFDELLDQALAITDPDKRRR